MKLFQSIRKWYQTKAYARTVLNFAALAMVCGVFLSLTALGVFDRNTIKVPPAEYLSLASEQNDMKPEELEQKLKARSSDVKELIFFEGTKFVAVLGNTFEGEKLVAPVDVEEIERLADQNQVKRSTKGSIAIEEMSSKAQMLWYAILAGLGIWLAILIFKKPDEDTFCLARRTWQALGAKQLEILSKRKLRTTRVHLYAIIAFGAVLATLFGSRFLLNPPAPEVPVEYNTVKRSPAWQVQRHLDRAPGEFERAVVVDKTNSVYVVIQPRVADSSVKVVPEEGKAAPAPVYTPTIRGPHYAPTPPAEAAAPDCSMGPELCTTAVVPYVAPVTASKSTLSPRPRLVQFANTAEGQKQLNAFVAQLNAANVQIKHVPPHANSNVFATTPAVWAAIMGAMFVILIVWSMLVVGHWALWTEREGGKTRDKAIAIGGGRSGSAIGDVAIANEDKKLLSDVAGCEEAIDKFRLVAGWIKDALVYQHFGATLPKGILLSGPPGTGKTLLARALAGELDGNYFYASGSEFVNKYVGVGADNVRGLFGKAKKAFQKTGKPSIVFIDEIDAVGKQRSADGSGGEGERDQTVNQLLTCIQGFDPNNGTLVIAATNRPETLDSGLTRSGRFDYKVEVGRPDRKGRKAIYAVYLRNRQLEPGVTLEDLADDLARRSHDFVGADIELVVNVACTRAAKRNAPDFVGKTAEEIAGMPRIITREDLHSGVDQVMYGELIKSKVRSADERRATAIHEIGHACIPTVLKGDPVSRITIVMTTKSLGLMESHPEEDRYGWSKEEFIQRIKTMLAGRAAEELIGKSVSTGASNDFERASQLARCMAAVYGMTDELGVISLPVDRYGFPVSNIGPDLQAEFNRTWRKIIKDCDEDTRRIIEENRDKIVRVSEVLFEEETLTGDQFRELWNQQ